MDQELERILNSGFDLREKYRGGEYQGSNWVWREHLEEALREYWLRRFMNEGVLE